MNIYCRAVSIVFAALLACLFAVNAQAQADEPNYVFVIFETTVTRQGIETSDAEPEERRFYVSNLVAVPSEDPALLRRASRLADDYFTATVVEPMKAKGILHQYYDDGIRINDNVVYRLDTRAEVDDLQKKTLEGLKEQGANIFTFTWKFGEKPGGLEMSHPVLFYREPKKPLYGMTEKPATPAVPKTQPKPKPHR